MSQQGNALKINLKGGFILVHEEGDSIKFSSFDEAGRPDSCGWWSQKEDSIRNLVTFLQAWLGKKADEKPQVTP